MNVNKIVTAALGIMIAVVMIGGAFLPAISSSVDEIGVKYNNPTGVLSKMSEGETVTVVIDVETGQITVNGEYTINSGVATISDQFIISSTAGNLLYNSVNATQNITEYDITVNLNGKNAIVTYGETTDNYTFDWCFYPSIDGDYRGYANATSNKEIYLNDIDQLYGANWLNSKNVWFSFVGDTVKVGGITTEADYSLNQLGNYSDAYTLMIGGGAEGQYTFTYDEYVTHPRFYVMPAEIEAHTSADNAIIAMYNILPIVAIAGLVMAGIYVFFTRK